MREGLTCLFPILIDHLYVSDIFRLSHALSYAHPDWNREDVQLVRKTLRVPPRVTLAAFLATYEKRPRCRQCGVQSRAVHPRYCRDCSRYVIDSPVLMVDRLYVTHRYKEPGGRRCRYILDNLRVVKRGGNKAHLFYRRDVEALSSQFDERHARHTPT